MKFWDLPRKRREFSPDPYEQTAMRNRLEQIELTFQSLFDHNPNVVALFDGQGKFVRINETAKHVLGYQEQDIDSLTYNILVTKETLSKTRQYLRMVRNGTPQTFETAILHKDGYRVDLNATAIPIKNEGTTSGYILICQDISERKRAEEQMRYMAYYDDRTGLPNRRLFTEHLTEVLISSRALNKLVAVLYLDIDQFKLINDSYGHDYGDLLLMQVAERLNRVSTENDFVARTEGDEFAVFCTGLSSVEDVQSLAIRFFSVLEQPFQLEQYTVHITSSMGIAINTEENEEAATLMKNADIALSRAKETGKNNYKMFNAEMKVLLLKRMTLENELRRAITQDEFVLYYQPQVDIHSGKIIGMEALIRWNHPQRGLISPQEFIPFAEETGLIVQIGEWVLRAACMQNKLWQEQGYPPVPVSVNLSTRQFMQYDLQKHIADVLSTSGLKPEYLELEITESMAMDVDHAIKCLLDLKKLGVQISIDDFGTGYSSLYYLKKFPIDKLKIDRSFVRDILEDPSDAAIVASIISMTQHLNLKVVAEGVETEEQLKFLQVNKCNEVQGYFFSPPIQPAQMQLLLEQQSPYQLNSVL